MLGRLIGREDRPRFEGRVVAITGAAGGLGAALARRFAKSGARLLLLDVAAERLAETAAAIEATGACVLAVPTDATCPAACADAIARAEERWGRIDVLVNNAGITHISPFSETDLAVIRRVMDVNFFGAVNATKAALPAIVKRRGLIVAISSIAGFAPLLERTGYAASKHALHGFFESLRTELAPRGTAVMLVCPSYIDTDIGRHAMGGDGGRITRPRAVLGRAKSPDEVASAIHDAALARRRQLILSPVGKASWWLSRLLPAVYDQVMVRTHAG